MKSESKTFERPEFNKLNDLITDIKTAMLTTASPDGSLQSRPMMTQELEADGSLWFFTRRDSGKAQAAQEEPFVNLAFAEPSKSKFVSISGRATLERNEAKMRELWSPLHQAWFPNGVEDPELTLMHVRPESAEYWDAPAGKMIQFLKIVGAALTRKPPHFDRGENAKLRLAE